MVQYQVLDEGLIWYAVSLRSLFALDWGCYEFHPSSEDRGGNRVYAIKFHAYESQKHHPMAKETLCRAHNFVMLIQNHVIFPKEQD